MQFIKEFVKIAKPLTKLLQKNETFRRSENAEKASVELK